jgi:hypothetical protein
MEREEVHVPCMLYVDELAQYIGRKTANWQEKPVQNMSKRVEGSILNGL